MTPGLYITSPEDGAVVEGIVEIRGSVPEDRFSSAELLYAYTKSEIETWFLIKRLDQVVQDDILATWDTTTITDGLYRIKLVSRTLDGIENEVITEGITVANYSRDQDQTAGKPESMTGGLARAADSLVATPAPTDFYTNPASIKQTEVRRTVLIGIIFAFVILGFLAFYTGIQSLRRRK